MGYVEKVNRTLRPKKLFNTKVLDLFAGCGGLALGFEALGFETFGYEMNSDAAATYEKNLGSPCETISLTKDFIFPKADILIGGPPCQPFSVLGKQLGKKDRRDGFPIFLEAVKQTQPKIFLIENVKGLVYSNTEYFNSLITAFEGLGYIIEYKILNAVNFLVPQSRERLIIVGHRSNFLFPDKIVKKITVSDAIGDSMYKRPKGYKLLTPAMDKYIESYERASACINPRDLFPAKPARTLTYKNLSGATGDMLRVRLKNGQRRMLTVREAARLQSFPDWFEFVGNESSQFNQIGNAVPPLLSYYLAKSVSQTIQFRQKSLERIKEINSNKGQVMKMV